MTRSAEMVIDRKRLKASLNFWRLLAFISITLIGIVFANNSGLFKNSEFIARLSITGIITDNNARNKILKEIENDQSIKALIVKIDSPGGTFLGGETLFQGIRKIAKKKPVVSLLGGTATSAAYLTAIGADYIVAHAGTLTGSIGVILQSADLTGLLNNLGIKPEIVKSGDLKGQPNPLENFSEKARKITLRVVNDFYAMFVDIIAERRSLQRETVLRLADGRLFSGRMALTHGLVDLVGSEEDAKKWLENSHSLAPSLSIIDVKISEEPDIWKRIRKLVLGENLISERLRLDGVLSLWQPSSQF